VNNRQHREPQLLDQIRADVEQRLVALAHVWCHEKIFRYSRTGSSTHSVDTVEADVELVDGVEKYTSVHSGGTSYRKIEDAGGAWSSGEIATILRTSRNIILSEPSAMTGIGTEDGGETAVVFFRHPLPDNQWTLAVGSRVYPMSFEGKIWVSKTSAAITRIQWRATNPSREISQVEWAVDFGPAVVGGKASTASVNSTYTVAYKRPKERVDWNETLFSDFRTYSSEAVIRYEQDEQESVSVH
jgi:hypothetical protein